MYSNITFAAYYGGEGTKKLPTALKQLGVFGSGYENRTRIACVRGMCPNH